MYIVYVAGNMKIRKILCTLTGQCKLSFFDKSLSLSLFIYNIIRTSETSTFFKNSCQKNTRHYYLTNTNLNLNLL